MPHANQAYPVDAVIPDVLRALRAHPACVLVAPTGAGKTTRLPPALLDAHIAPGEVLLLEPRRIAARAAARRMAAERGERVGQTVGYHVRFDKKRSAATRLMVLTENMLTRRMASDPTLDDVGVVVLDEFHERSVAIDLSLSFLRTAQELRDDLKIVVMSATLDAPRIAAFLGGDAGPVPIVQSEGRLFPLTTTYEPPARVQHARESTERHVSRALRDLLRAPDDDGGDVLVFLPGKPEIGRVERHLAQHPLPGSPAVLPLFGGMSAEAQDRVLSRSTGRRVILATNVAESSLTLDGVTAVVDTGQVKLARYDAGTGLTHLDLTRVGAKSADQRAGRAGRQAPGRVVRLWSEAEQQRLAAGVTPAIRRADPAETLLAMLAFDATDPADVPLLDPLDPGPYAAGLAALRALDALPPPDAAAPFALTARGKALASVPAPPHIAALLLSDAARAAPQRIARLAALLSEEDIARGNASRGERRHDARGDILWRLDALDTLASARFDHGLASRLGVDARRARHTAQAAQQLERMVPRGPRGAAGTAADLDPHGDAIVTHALLDAFRGRTAKRRADGERALLENGSGVRLQSVHAMAGSPLFIAVGLRGSSAQRRPSGGAREALVSLAHPVTEDDLEQHGVGILTRTRMVFDAEREAVIGVHERHFYGLVLKQTAGGKTNADEASARLAEAAADRFDSVFNPDGPTTQLLARLALLAARAPELELAADPKDVLKQALPALCAGKKSFAQLRKLDWARAATDGLPWPVRQALDTRFPERIRVPSGNNIRLDYTTALTEGGAPVLAVKLQEMFGQTDTPRIDGGRLALRLHLLAPNMRPAQVTEDLASFWANTYSEVRKDLRRRYPKHAWPDDPLTAPPERRPRRRRS